jgi:hypothetical protein
VAYRAEIEIGIRGAARLKDLQNRLKNLATLIDENNKKPLFDRVAVQSVSQYTDALSLAKRELDQVQIELDSAGKATGLYANAIKEVVTAQVSFNEVSKLTSRQLREEVDSRGAAAKAIRDQVEANIELSRASREASNFGAGRDPVAKSIARRRRKLAGDPSAYAGPIGPALSGLQGQSSPVAERLSRQLRDQAKLKASLLALDEKSVAAARERLNLSTQLKEELNDIKVAAKIGPREPEGFSKAAGQRKVDDSVRRQQIMKEGAEFAAQQEANRKATIESYNKVAQFAKKNEATVFGIRAKNIRRSLDLEFDKIAKQAAAEGKAADKLIAKRISDNRKAEADFDKRLDREIKAKIKAANDVKRAEKRIANEDSGRTAASKKRRNDAISSGLIGGAFPLLFGQGGGAAIGGGIGGFAGGMIGGQMGFALSLVGTQFGAFADQIVAGSATLGQALNPLTADIEALADAAGFAGTETGAALQAIEQLGTQQQALEAATALLAATVGNEGVDALNSFGAETADLGNEFARAMTQMQSAAARFFAGIPGFIANALKAGNDLQAGLNLDTPEARELQERRNELTGVDTVGAAGGMGGLSAKDMKELVAINKRLTELGQERTAEAQRQAKLTAEELQHKTLLQQLGVKDSKLQEIEAKLAGTKADYTNENFVNLTRQAIIREADLKREKALETVGRDENGNIKDRAALLIKNGQITQASISQQADLTLKVNKALESRDKKLARETSRTDKQTEQSRALTSSLERQLAQSKVAGTEQAKKLAIEQKYEQTLERIAKLKDQSEAPEQRKLANQIKTNAEAKLAFDQEQKRAKALRDAVAPLKQIQESQAANLASSKEYNRLIMEGVLPAEAKRIVEYNKQAAALILQKNELIEIEKAKLLSLDIDSEQAKALRQRIDDLKEERGLIESKAAEGPGKGKTPEERIKDQIAVIQGGLNDLLDPTNQIIELSTQIGDAFSESFKGIIDGSMSAREALANLFQRTADHFLDMATQIIAAQLKMQLLNIGLSFFGGGGYPLVPSAAPKTGDAAMSTLTNFLSGRANGGPVSGSTPYMVGEKGPELFVPNTSGNIVPNNKLGGGGSTNVVVNVDAKDSSASGDTGTGKELGRLIGAAVQAELVKQQRPGGLLS